MDLAATLGHRPVSNLSLRLEGRYDRSLADVFAGEAAGQDGPSFSKDSQFLLLFGAVASF